MSERSEAYLAGYSCGYTKPDTKNCNFKFFADELLLAEWNRGKGAGERDRIKMAEENGQKIKNKKT